MPFTPSHVAAVLPLLRRRSCRLSATGLIAGSVAPDFEKFLRMGLHNAHSHSWASLLYFSLPVGLGLGYLFHAVVRDALLTYLPRPLRQRLAGLPRPCWRTYFRRHWAVVGLSVVLGGATHLLWDGLTHRRPYLHAYLPQLLTRLPQLPNSPPVYQLLDFLSSVGGLLAVVLAVARLPRHAAPAPARPAQWRFWGLATLTAGLLLAARTWLVLPHLDATNLLVSALSAGMLGVVVAALGLPAPTRPAAAPAR